MPGLTCTVCQHPNRKEIDTAIVKGEAKRAIAKRFDVGHSSVHRHALHLPKQLARSAQAKEAVYVGSVFNRLESIYRETADDREHLRQEGNHELALRYTVELRKMLELHARITGELKESGIQATLTGPVQVNVIYESRTLSIASDPSSTTQSGL